MIRIELDAALKHGIDYAHCLVGSKCLWNNKPGNLLAVLDSAFVIELDNGDDSWSLKYAQYISIPISTMNFRPYIALERGLVVDTATMNILFKTERTQYDLANPISRRKFIDALVGYDIFIVSPPFVDIKSGIFPGVRYVE